MLVKSKKKSIHLQWTNYQVKEFHLLYYDNDHSVYAEHIHGDETLWEKLADLTYKL